MLLWNHQRSIRNCKPDVSTKCPLFHVRKFCFKRTLVREIFVFGLNVHPNCRSTAIERKTDGASYLKKLVNRCLPQLKRCKSNLFHLVYYFYILLLKTFIDQKNEFEHLQIQTPVMVHLEHFLPNISSELRHFKRQKIGQHFWLMKKIDIFLSDKFCVLLLLIHPRSSWQFFVLLTLKPVWETLFLM